MTEQPEFENIIGYENLYKINRQGDIWSCSSRKVITPSLQNGYLCVGLTKEGKRHKCYIARLLGLQYIPNPTNSPTIDHIDRNRTNNCLTNLRWATMTEQANNKTTNIALLTEEEQVQRIEDIKEYKTTWARHNRLRTGETPLIPIPLMTEEAKQETQTAYNISRRVENLSAERIEVIRLQNQKSRENHIQTEDEKASANARSKAQREKIKADPEKLAEQKEYKKLKAREYRLKAQNTAQNL